MTLRSSGRGFLGMTPSATARDAFLEKVRASGLRPHDFQRLVESDREDLPPDVAMRRYLEAAAKRHAPSSLFDTPMEETPQWPKRKSYDR